ncbi:hypothetical protein [Gorillibacterium sp. CAU 1737]|uniref:hypothetical protein n=1 Tax=Gorillibacterium sp. CAU 1737 TaxID=3140362 RepID=UPI003260D6D3
MSFSAEFIKDKDYKRMHITGILSSVSSGMIQVDLYEETNPIMRKFFVNEEGKTESDFGGHNLENYVHATIVVSPNNIPSIIASLQGVYDKYMDNGE